MYKKIISFGFLLSLLSVVSASNVFTTENTQHWNGYTDDCISAESNRVAVTPSTIPTNWDANTIYEFADGTYNITSTININQSCIALIGSNNTIFNGTVQLINITAPFFIIKNITLDGINKGQRGIQIAGDNITINSNSIKNTLQGIFSDNSNYVYINNNKIINNSIGIRLNSSSYNLINNSVFWGNGSPAIMLINNANHNKLNNIILFNNTNGIIDASSAYNIYNNILSFNNSQRGIRIQSSAGSIVVNNSLFYNNAGNGVDISNTNINPVLNNVKSFNNLTDFSVLYSTTSYGLLQNISTIGLITLGVSSDSILGSIGWTNGTNNDNLTVDSTQILNPHDGTNFLIDTTTATGTRRGVKTFGDNFVVSSSSWGANVPNQIQPVQRNAAGTQLENSSIGFSASKKIGEVVITSSSPSGGSSGGAPSQPICGNKIIETGEECDDGNRRNGDGCSSTCKIEQPGICGNGKLEYMEECDDGNTKDGDGCNSSCKIEGANLILSPKLLLQQKALEKTLGIPAALIDLNNIETTSDFILSTINQNQKQQVEQCQYNDADYGKILFNDNKSTYQQQIDTLLNYCIVQGKQIGNQRVFGTKDFTTYAEFIKVLVKAHFLGTSMDFHNNTFDIQKIYKDVSKNSRYAPYIIKAYVHDLLIPIEKLENNKINISPEENITRLDAIRLLIHSLKLANKNPKNIEIITDSFEDANKILTREEMAALIVRGYELDYDTSLRMRSNNGILMKLLAEHIKKYKQSEQISILKNMTNKIEKINDNILKKLNIHKKQLVSDIEILIDFSEVFLK